MKVIFVRHAAAEGRDRKPDAKRELTGKGRQQAGRTAAGLKRIGATAARVLTSPLARAVQTAEIVAETFGDARVEQADFLAPPVDADAMAERIDALADEAGEADVLVGHAPTLDQLAETLAVGKAVGLLSLSKASAACVEIDEDERELAWVLHRDQLALLAESRTD